MGTLFRKLRRELLANGRLRHYFPYALGEIILVVMGILIALQVDRWNDKRLERIQERKLYKSLGQQVADHREELTGVLSYNRYFLTTYRRANDIITARDSALTDSLALMAMFLSQYSDFHRDARIYDNLAASGQLGLVSNTELTEALQQLQMTYAFINKLEDMHWDMIINNLSPELRPIVNYNTLKAVDPDRLFATEMQNIFVESIYLTGIKDSLYRRALSEIDSLQELLERQLED